MISSSIPSTSRMTSISIHSRLLLLLLPFRVVVFFRRWIDDKGETEVLIVFLHFFFFLRRFVCRAHLLVRTHINCVCECVCVYNPPLERSRVCVCKSERVCTLFMSFRVSSLLSSLHKKKVSTCTWMHSSSAPPPPPPPFYVIFLGNLSL